MPVRSTRRTAAPTCTPFLLALLIAVFASSVSYGQETGARHGKLTETMIHNKNTRIDFFEPAKEILVNYKILRSDFLLYNGMVTFRLDGKQRGMRLECGLSDYGPEQASNQLTLIGDGKELLSLEYNAGEDSGVSEIDMQGVQALTFRLGGTTSGYLYCKDETVY